MRWSALLLISLLSSLGADLGSVTFTVEEDGLTLAKVPQGETGRLVIPEEIDGKKVRRVGTGALSGCIYLTEVELPSTVTNIDNYAFFSCKSMARISSLTNVMSIGLAAFNHCEALVEVELAANLSRFGHQVFEDCYSLERARYPSFPGNGGGYCFRECRSLKTVVVSANVTNFNNTTFNRCPQLQELRFEGNFPHFTPDTNSFVTQPTLIVRAQTALPLTYNGFPVTTEVKSWIAVENGSLLITTDALHPQVLNLQIARSFDGNFTNATFSRMGDGRFAVPLEGASGFFRFRY